MDFTAIILAGGKSSRMGKDKGLMMLNGKPMISHVINTVKPFVKKVVIISNNNAYKTLGYSVYEDLIEEKGPLSGIYTGLMHSKHEKNIVLSCDVPFISKEMIQLLIDKSDCFDVTVLEKRGKKEPLIGIYVRSCRKIFEKEIENEQLKLQVAIEKVNLNVITGDQFDDYLFSNINSPNDIKS